MGRFNRRKKGFMLIAAFFFMIAASMVGMVSLSIVSKESEVGNNYMLSAQSLFIAGTGMQYAMEVLSQDNDWTNNASITKNVSNGSFTVDFINPQSSEVTLRVEATLGQTKRIIQRVVFKFHKAFEYCMYGGDDVSLFLASGDIQGDIAAGDNIRLSNWIDHDGEEFEDSDDYFPSVDYDYWRDKAQDEGNYVNGDMVFENGQTYEGTYYVTGNATIRNQTTINGTIVSENNVYAVFEYGAQINAPEGQPAIIAKKDFRGGASIGLDVNGLIYAEDDIFLNLALWPEVNGALLAGDDIFMALVFGLDYTYDEDAVKGLAGFTSSHMTIGKEGWTEK